MMTGGGWCKFKLNARSALPLHIQSMSVCYSPLAFRFIAKQVLRLPAFAFHLGAILGPPWGRLWRYLGPSQGPLEGLLGPPGAIMGYCVVVLGLISDLGGCKFNYNARNALPLHIQSTSIRYSPLAFRFIARQVHNHPAYDCG